MTDERPTNWGGRRPSGRVPKIAWSVRIDRVTLPSVFKAARMTGEKPATFGARVIREEAARVLRDGNGPRRYG